MNTARRILVAVDDSEASRRAVAYAADFLDGASDVEIALLHIDLPPRMLEWGGAEDPKVEKKVEAERANAYHGMEARRKAKADELLKRMQAMFVKQGAHVAGRFVRFEEPLDTASVSRAILRAAREQGCGTVVVGRHSFATIKRWFQHHVGEELIRDGSGIAVWVVE